jgi:TP901 family phage tail tape measure protein
MSIKQTLQVEITAVADKFLTGINRATTGLKGFSTEITTSQRQTGGIRGSIDDLGKSLSTAGERFAGAGASARSMGTTLSVGLTAPIVAAGAGILAMAGDFESAMQGVKAISKNITDNEFTALRDMAKEMGATTKFSATEAAKGMEFLAMAGFNANQTMAAMPSLLALASAGSLELARASDIASNVLGGFGLAAEETGRVADVLALAAASSNTSVEQMGQALSFVAPVAKAAGLSLEETAARIGVLGDSGVQATRAGTGLRGILGDLVAPSSAAGKELEKMGFNLEELGKKTPLEQMAALGEAGMGNAEALKIFGIQGATSALIMQDASEKASTLTTELQNAKGAAQEMAKTKEEGLNGALTELGSAFEGLAIAIADAGLLKFAEDVVRGFSSLIRTLNETNPVILRVGTVIAGIAAVIGPVVLAVGAFSGAWAAAVPVITAAGGVLASISFAGVAAGAQAAAVAFTGFAAAAAPAVLAVAAAFTFWNIGEWLYHNIPLVKQLGDAIVDLALSVPAIKGMADAYTGVTAAQADLDKQTRGLAKTLAAKGIVIEKDLFESMDQYRARLQAAAKEAGFLGGEAKKSGEELAKTEPKSKAAASGADAVRSAMETGARAVREMAASAKDLGTANDDVLLTIESGEAATRRITQAYADLGIEWTNTITTVGELDHANKELARTYQDMRFDLAAVAGAFEGAGAAQERLRIATEATTRATQDLRAEAPQLTGEVQDFGGSLDGLVPKLDSLEDAMGGVNTEVSAAKPKISETQAAFLDFSAKIQDAVTRMDIGGKIFAGKFAPGEWRKTLDGMATDLKNKLMSPAIDIINNLVDKGVKVLMGALDGLIAKLIGQGGVSAAFSAVFGGGASAAGSAAGGIGGAAGGAGGAASAVGSGLTGIVGAIGSVGSMVSGIIGNFQQRNTNDRLWQIEENTRKLFNVVHGELMPDQYFKSDMLQWGPQVKVAEEQRNILNDILGVLRGGIAVTGAAAIMIGTATGESVGEVLQDPLDQIASRPLMPPGTLPPGSTFADLLGGGTLLSQPGTLPPGSTFADLLGGGTGGVFSAPTNSRTGQVGTTPSGGGFSAPTNSRTGQVGTTPSGGGFSAPTGSRTGQIAAGTVTRQEPGAGPVTFASFSVADRQAIIDLANETGRLAEMFGPGVDASAGSRFSSSADISGFLEEIGFGAHQDQLASIGDSNDQIARLLSEPLTINAPNLEEGMRRLEAALNRPIIMEVDGREIARVVGDNQAALGVTA